MIHIDRKLLSPKAIKSKRFKKLIERLLKEKSKHDFEKHRTYISRLSKNLKLLYNYKCGYCETRINPGSYMPMDHYRPKGKLKDEESHTGYYWLWYEWTNLVPACTTCNSAKSTYFPIDTSEGERVTVPPMDNGCLDMEACRVDSKIHIAEEPLLLHPEVDRPEEHLIFLPNGEVKGISLKGKTSVGIYKLSRTELLMARKGVIDRFFKAVATPLQQSIKNGINKDILLYALDNVFNIMKRAREPHRPYSRLGWFLFEEFETFFIQRLRVTGMKKSARIVEEAFFLFCENGTCRRSKTQV